MLASLGHSQSIFGKDKGVVAKTAIIISKAETCKVVSGTGLAKKAGPRLRECSRQCQEDVVSKSRNKIHQTCESKKIVLST